MPTIDNTIVVYRQEHEYNSHPCAVTLQNGEWLVTFSHSMKRYIPKVHPPNDPMFVNLLTRSSDEGKTWSAPRVVPNFDWYGMENPGVMQLSSGEVLLNQWRYRWLPSETALKRWRAGDTELYCYSPDAIGNWKKAESEADWEVHLQSIFPYARGDVGAFVQISHDNGGTWDESIALDTSPYLGAFSPKGGIELANGEVLLALGSQDHDPLLANFVLKSKDKGRTWSKAKEVARMEGHRFFEPSIVQTVDGTVVMASRDDTTGYIFLNYSHDDGESWTPCEQLDYWGYPQHVIRLKDGRLLMVYGRRKEPCGIRGVVSTDTEGKAWGEEFVIRDGLEQVELGYNFGYPAAIEYAPGKLFIVYYCEDSAGTTGIEGTYISL